ncbi:MAG TPA: putative O-glycosylation ligase, exosortase A system-associated [Gammaproteobacteria bacterium]|nr:putative O-glycosylation ligase, exosortase A system-associated [Gammaproteobacteria bacterium]
MRGLLITLVVFGSLPFIFVEPILGLLMWAWLSYMTPYRLAWGFAHNVPFVFITALAALISLVISKRRKWFPWTATTRVWVVFLVWLTISMMFAIYPHAAFVKWEEVMKIQLMVLVTFLLIHERRHLDWVIWVAVISVGFYGIKGGIFTILTGGHYHVWGPPGSWIGDNNELGAAVLLVMPLMRYLQLHDSRRWMWWGLTGAMVLSAFTVLGTYSRGDFLGAAAMVGVFWWRSRRKVLMTLPLIAVAAGAVAFMPSQWVTRMYSTSDYQHDASAQGRINAWHMAINMAEHRLTGGGFESVSKQTFERYAPEPNNVHAFHSIFFQILGDSGFIGLGLYLLLGFLTFRNCRWILRNAKGRDDLLWARDLAAMLQVGFTGFAASAAFLSLSYYDLPYQLMACVVLLQQIVIRELSAEVSPAQVRSERFTWRPRWQVGRTRPAIGEFSARQSSVHADSRLAAVGEPSGAATYNANGAWRSGEARTRRGSG